MKKLLESMKVWLTTIAITSKIKRLTKDPHFLRIIIKSNIDYVFSCTKLSLSPKHGCNHVAKFDDHPEKIMMCISIKVYIIKIDIDRHKYY